MKRGMTTSNRRIVLFLLYIYITTLIYLDKILSLSSASIKLEKEKETRKRRISLVGRGPDR